MLLPGLTVLDVKSKPGSITTSLRRPLGPGPNDILLHLVLSCLFRTALHLRPTVSIQ